MSRLERFLGKPKIVEIGGEELKLKPLTIKDLDIIMDLGDEKKKNDAMIRLVTRTLERSFPEDTPEQREGFSLKYFEELIAAIMEVNNLGDKKKMKVAKDLSSSPKPQNQD